MFFQIDLGYCLYLAWGWTVFGLLKPAVLYYVLRQDSSYWQGLVLESLAERTLKRGPSTSNIRAPLLGTSLEPDTAQELATQMDSLQRNCHIINFASLTLGDGRQQQLGERIVLGAGGTARVFKGMYQRRKVAVKMLYCMTLTPETVYNFCQESALLSRLKHPNVVHVEGVCVLPPCISIVMELCKGSLFELLRLQSAVDVQWDVRLTWAMDCARAVACLHGQTPPLLHMDLKSSNFLLGENTVQIWTPSDVQSWLRTIAMPQAYASAFAGASIAGKDLLVLDQAALARLVGKKGCRMLEYPALLLAIEGLAEVGDIFHQTHGVIKITDLELSKTRQDMAARKYEHEVADTINWTAPEVIAHGKRHFTAASDVYALGMVLWEVLTGQVPFDFPGTTPLVIGQRIVKEQLRPPVPPDTAPEYVALLTRTWAADPLARPTAADVVHELVLMRRRWQANRTLDEGRFVPTAVARDTSEDDFADVRFAGPEPPRQRLSSSSMHSMGSLSRLSGQDTLSSSLARSTLGCAGSRGRSRSHNRAMSEGHIAIDFLTEDARRASADKLTEDDLAQTYA